MLLAAVQESSSSPVKLMASLDNLTKQMFTALETRSVLGIDIDYACSVLTSILKQMMEPQPLPYHNLKALTCGCFAIFTLLAQTSNPGTVSEELGKLGACEVFMKLVQIAMTQNNTSQSVTPVSLKELAMRVIFLMSENELNATRFANSENATKILAEYIDGTDTKDIEMISTAVGAILNVFPGMLIERRELVEKLLVCGLHATNTMPQTIVVLDTLPDVLTGMLQASTPFVPYNILKKTATVLKSLLQSVVRALDERPEGLLPHITNMMTKGLTALTTMVTKTVHARPSCFVDSETFRRGDSFHSHSRSPGEHSSRAAKRPSLRVRTVPRID